MARLTGCILSLAFFSLAEGFNGPFARFRRANSALLSEEGRSGPDTGSTAFLDYFKFEPSGELQKALGIGPHPPHSPPSEVVLSHLKKPYYIDNDRELLSNYVQEVSELVEAAKSEAQTDWNSLSVEKLKQELKSRGLGVGGVKAQLVARLESSDQERLRALANAELAIADAAAAMSMAKSKGDDASVARVTGQLREKIVQEFLNPLVSRPVEKGVPLEAIKGAVALGVSLGAVLFKSIPVACTVGVGAAYIAVSSGGLGQIVRKVGAATWDSLTGSFHFLQDVDRTGELRRKIAKSSVSSFTKLIEVAKEGQRIAYESQQAIYLAQEKLVEKATMEDAARIAAIAEAEAAAIAEAEEARVRAEEEVERIRAEEEAVRIRAEEEEAARIRAVEKAARIRAEEEATRIRAKEEEAARIRAEEEAARVRAKEEEAARIRAKEEEAARIRAEDEASRIRAKEEEAARIRAKDEEVARIRAEEEEASRIRAQAEAARIRAEEEEAARIRAQEEAARICAEEEEAARIRAQEEAARIRAEEEEMARIRAAEEEAARIRAAEEEAARIRAEEEKAARIRAEEEEAARIRAEEEEAELLHRQEEEEAAAIAAAQRSIDGALAGWNDVDDDDDEEDLDSFDKASWDSAEQVASVLGSRDALIDDDDDEEEVDYEALGRAARAAVEEFEKRRQLVDDGLASQKQIWADEMVSASAVDWTKLTVAKLREELESRGLPSNGKKAELVARLEMLDDGLDDAVAVEPAGTINGEGPAEMPPPPSTQRDWTLLTVAQLRSELKSRGLPTAGKKGDLIALLEAVESDDDDDDDIPEDDVDLSDFDMEELGKAARMAADLFNGNDQFDDEPSDEALWEIENGPGRSLVASYDTMSVADLKEELRRRGLPVSGKKADLVARLEGSD